MSTTLKIIFLVIIPILLVLSAFFSAAETAYTSVSLIKIKTYERRGKKWAMLVKKQHKSFGWILATILLSNNIVNVAMSSLTTYLISDLINSGVVVTIVSIAIVTPIIVVFGEIFPKIIARKYSIWYLKNVVYVMQFLNYLFFPITYPLSKITLSSKITNTENEIQTMLSIAQSEGVLERNEATLAKKALELDSKKVKSVMTQKKEIVSINSKSTVKVAKNLFAKSGFSRILVKQKNLFIGYIILKDIIFADDNSRVDKYLVNTTYVSQSMLVSNALEKMRIENCHIALVETKNDSHSVVGIITIEDIIEELVGEIYDEHDEVDEVREVAHFKYVVNGSTLMRDVEKELEVTFEDVDDEISVKKWIQSRINRTIKQNLKYRYKKKIIFDIIKNNNNSETVIQITKKK